ncbi:MAG: serine/threonine-protein kinase [Armatimonadetes bacterium]|nr:serine/threonine-protein kinase [Armatimonadota bacterium]
MYEVGDRIDDQFVCLERHEGGMGIVFVVLDELTQHKYAVKTLRSEYVGNPAALDRFRQEARTWLAIGHHPHLVYAVIYREIGEVPLLFIEYVDGASLADLLGREHLLFLPQAVDYALQVCDALEYLHRVETPAGEHGVIHRDLKPANVLVNRLGVAKVTDFGLAKIHGDIVAQADGRRGLGTYFYMPPEQVLDAASADHRSDIYSFGAMLYHLVTGRPPVQGGDTKTIVGSILRRMPPEPSAVNAAIPEQLSQLIMRCLAKARNERPSTVSEVREELEGLVEAVEQAVADKRFWVCQSCGYRTGRRQEACPVCAQPLVSGEKAAQKVEEPSTEQAAQAGAEEAAMELLARALEQRSAGRVDQALVMLRQAVALAPEKAEVVKALDETALMAARQKSRDSHRSYNWPMEGGNINRISYTPEVVAPPLRLLWVKEIAEWIAAPAVIANGVVFVGGYVNEPGRYGRFCALRASDGEILWELRANKEFVTAACITQGRVGYVATGSRLVAVDVATGRPLWDVDLHADIFGSPVAVENMVLVPTSAGRLHALGSRTGQEVWSFAAGGPLLPGATVGKEMVWVGSADQKVHGLDLVSGKSIWEYATGGEIEAPLAYFRDRVLVPSLDHRLHCLLALSGRKSWEFEADGEIHSSPAVWQDTVVVGTRGGSVFGLSCKTGQRKWRFAVGDWVDSSPSLSGRCVYFGSHDGYLYALERETGLLLWRQEIGCELPTGPAISAGLLVIAGRDGKVYCFRAR